MSIADYQESVYRSRAIPYKATEAVEARQLTALKMASAQLTDIIRQMTDSGDLEQDEQVSRGLYLAKRMAIQSLMTQLGDGISGDISETVAAVTEETVSMMETITDKLDDEDLDLSNFASIPQTVVQEYAHRSDVEGLKISPSIWAGHQTALIENKVLSALARGQSATSLAEDLQKFVLGGSEGMGQSVAYKAFRLARSEINNAYHESRRLSAIASPVVAAMEWKLSNRHPGWDICNMLAQQNLYGLGAGVYPSEQLPPKPHPNCICYTLDKLRSPADWQKPKPIHRMKKSPSEYRPKGQGTQLYIKRQYEFFDQLMETVNYEADKIMPIVADDLAIQPALGYEIPTFDLTEAPLEFLATDYFSQLYQIPTIKAALSETDFEIMLQTGLIATESGLKVKDVKMKGAQYQWKQIALDHFASQGIKLSDTDQKLVADQLKLAGAEAVQKGLTAEQMMGAKTPPPAPAPTLKPGQITAELASDMYSQKTVLSPGLGELSMADWMVEPVFDKLLKWAVKQESAGIGITTANLKAEWTSELANVGKIWVDVFGPGDLDSIVQKFSEFGGQISGGAAKPTPAPTPAPPPKPAPVPTPTAPSTSTYPIPSGYKFGVVSAEDMIAMAQEGIDALTQNMDIKGKPMKGLQYQWSYIVEGYYDQLTIKVPGPEQKKLGQQVSDLAKQAMDNNLTAQQVVSPGPAPIDKDFQVPTLPSLTDGAFAEMLDLGLNYTQVGMEIKGKPMTGLQYQWKQIVDDYYLAAGAKANASVQKTIADQLIKASQQAQDLGLSGEELVSAPTAGAATAGPAQIVPPAASTVSAQTPTTAQFQQKAVGPKNPIFPPDLQSVEFVQSLGGSTGAKLVKGIDAIARKFVLKKGANEPHLKEEMIADSIYKSFEEDRIGGKFNTMKTKVPDSESYQDVDGAMVKLSNFHVGESLADVLNGKTSLDVDRVKKGLQQGFVLDALIGNWDVVGLGSDNILVDQQHDVYRIDNGGALRFRAQGTSKGSKFRDQPEEIWTMMDKNLNAPSAKAFDGLTFNDVKKQADFLYENRDLILSNPLLDPALKAKLSKRLDALADDTFWQKARTEYIRLGIATPALKKKVSAETTESYRNVMTGITEKVEQDATFGRIAVSIDKEVVEDHNASIQKDIDPRGNVKHILEFKVTETNQDEFKKAMEDLGAKRDEWNYLSRQYDQGEGGWKNTSPSSGSNISFDKVWQYRRSDDQAYDIAFFDNISSVKETYGSSSTKALRGTVKIEVDGSLAQLQERLPQVISDLGLSPDLMATPADDDRLKLKTAQMFQRIAPNMMVKEGYSQRFTESMDQAEWDDLYKDAVGKMAKESKQSEDTIVQWINGMQLGEAFSGTDTYINQDTDYNQWVTKGVDYLIHSISPQRTADVFGTAGSQGLMSSRERFGRGITVGGGSTGDDFRTGGADSAFTRVVNYKVAPKRGIQDIGGAVSLILDKSLLSRSDWYAYKSDNFGDTDFKAHTYDRLTEAGKASASDNEVMFRAGIPAQFVRGIVCRSQSVKKELLDTLAQKGITQIGTVPINEYTVLVAANQDEHDYFKNPAYVEDASLLMPSAGPVPPPPVRAKTIDDIYKNDKISITTPSGVPSMVNIKSIFIYQKVFEDMVDWVGDNAGFTVDQFKAELGKHNPAMASVSDNKLDDLSKGLKKAYQDIQAPTPAPPVSKDDYIKEHFAGIDYNDPDWGMMADLDLGSFQDIVKWVDDNPNDATYEWDKKFQAKWAEYDFLIEHASMTSIDKYGAQIVQLIIDAEKPAPAPPPAPTPAPSPSTTEADVKDEYALLKKKPYSDAGNISGKWYPTEDEFGELVEWALDKVNNNQGSPNISSVHAKWYTLNGPSSPNSKNLKNIVESLESVLKKVSAQAQAQTPTPTGTAPPPFILDMDNLDIAQMPITDSKKEVMTKGQMIAGPENLKVLFEDIKYLTVDPGVGDPTNIDLITEIVEEFMEEEELPLSDKMKSNLVEALQILMELNLS